MYRVTVFAFIFPIVLFLYKYKNIKGKVEIMRIV